MHKMDQYFDLTDAQYTFYRSHCRKHLNWFRTTQIPWLLTELEQIQSQKAPLDPQYMRQLADGKVRALWLSVTDQMADDAAGLFKQLSSEQFVHFERQLEEDSKEFVELLDLPPEKFRKHYRRFQVEMMDKMEVWVGSLTAEQKSRIIELTAVTQEDYRREISILIEIKAEFLRQVKDKVREGNVTEFLRGWARQPNIAGDRYAIYRQWRVTRQLNLWIEMETLINPQQREFRKEKLDQLSADLRMIATTEF